MIRRWLAWLRTIITSHQWWEWAVQPSARRRRAPSGVEIFADEHAGRWRLVHLHADDGHAIEHIVPIDDEREHRLGLDCDCKPAIILQTRDCTQISHTSWDAREAWERHYAPAHREQDARAN